MFYIFGYCTLNYRIFFPIERPSIPMDCSHPSSRRDSIWREPTRYLWCFRIFQSFCEPCGGITEYKCRWIEGSNAIAPYKFYKRNVSFSAPIQSNLIDVIGNTVCTVWLIWGNENAISCSYLNIFQLAKYECNNLCNLE